MFTIIGGDGKEYGPVSAEQIRSWIAAGRANHETKIRAEGSADWRRLGDFPEFTSPATTAPAAAGAPVVVTDAKTYAADLLRRGRPLDVFGTIGQALELYQQNFLPLVGVTLLVVLAAAVAGAVPFLGILCNLLLTGVFYGGLYYYYIGRKRGEPREVGDAFSGFSRAFVPLMLTNLISSAITMAVIFACFMPLIGWFAKLAITDPNHIEASLPQLGPVAVVAIAIGSIVIIYLSIAWAFAFLLVIDQRLSPWTALEVSRRVISRNWFRVFFMMIIAGFLTLLGLIALIIGIFFTLPITFCAVTCAYEALCRPPADP